MAFTPQFLDEIRQRLSLAHVVSRRVKLTKRGRDYIGLCPFHKEKTPSFNVVEDKAFYHCFGCGAHGDVIGFTMRIGNLGFREAVEQLAGEAGLEVPAETPAARAQAVRTATLHDVCAAACEAFEAQLWSPTGAAGLAYLRGRGLTDDLIRRFRLGWAPDSRNFIRTSLGARIPEALLVEAGLLRQSEQGAFDFFRGRVIFPIFDRSGRIIAFGGRTLGDGQPKYLNSPDTPVFHKGRTLYAFHLARAAVTSETPPIVAEGYMDVIALHAAGFSTAVAPLGTALTEQHLHELWRVHPEPIVCFDGDAAGQRAATRTLDRALANLTTEQTIRFAALPEKHDPDSLIREAGAGAFKSVLAAAKSVSEFIWQSATRGRRVWTVEKIAQTEAELLRKLRLIPDRGLRFHLERDVRARAGDLFYQLRRREKGARSRSERVSSQLAATLTDEYTAWKLNALLLAGVINHPQIAEMEVDRLVMVGSHDSRLLALLDAIMTALPRLDAAGANALRDMVLEAGHGDLVDAVLRSDSYVTMHSLHPSADPYDAELTCRSLFARLRLPELREELVQAQAEWAAEGSEEAWQRVEVCRRIVEQINSEAELVPLQRDPIERWQPQPAIKTAPA